MVFSVIHPSRSRPDKSYNTILKWFGNKSRNNEVEFIISLDEDDPELGMYMRLYSDSMAAVVVNWNRSAVAAINNGALASKGEIFIVVSDDSDTSENWDDKILQSVSGKSDWILKVQDGIQDWILTQPIMDRAYYNRTGYIYHPDFLHMFCDTWLTVQADISGRKLTSELKFPHLNGSIQDDLRKRCDATWDQGEKLFIDLVKQTRIEDLNKITDSSMKNWIRNKTGIRV